MGGARLHEVSVTGHFFFTTFIPLVGTSKRSLFHRHFEVPLISYHIIYKHNHHHCFYFHHHCFYFQPPQKQSLPIRWILASGILAKIIHCNAHSFRRGFCVQQVKSGLSTRVVQSLGGWESISMVERYSKSLSFDESLKLYREKNGDVEHSKE